MGERIELCQSNSIGERYYEPRVVEYRTVSREEAETLLAKEVVNGYYWRKQPPDQTGNPDA